MRFPRTSMWVILCCGIFFVVGCYFLATHRPFVAAGVAIMAGVLIGGLLSLRDTPMVKKTYPLDSDEQDGRD